MQVSGSRSFEVYVERLELMVDWCLATCTAHIDHQTSSAEAS